MSMAPESSVRDGSFRAERVHRVTDAEFFLKRGALHNLSGTAVGFVSRLKDFLRTIGFFVFAYSVIKLFYRSCI